jgi:hypothetical protein
MKNRTTISAHLDQATIERIDQLAKLENRSRSQMAGTAIKLGAELSPEAWSVLLQLSTYAKSITYSVPKLSRTFLR